MIIKTEDGKRKNGKRVVATCNRGAGRRKSRITRTSFLLPRNTGKKVQQVSRTDTDRKELHNGGPITVCAGRSLRPDPNHRGGRAAGVRKDTSIFKWGHLGTAGPNREQSGFQEKEKKAGTKVDGRPLENKVERRLPPHPPSIQGGLRHRLC